MYNNSSFTEEELEATLEENQRRLRETAQIFIDRVIDKDIALLMPRELRYEGKFDSLS